MLLSWPVPNRERRRLSGNLHAMKLNTYRAFSPMDD
jgi:hypothetical protein